MSTETVFTVETSNIKFGPGATREVGQDARALGLRHVMVVTDPRLADSDPVTVTLQALKAAGVDAVLFGRVRVEPTDASFKEAIAFATTGEFDGYVAVGGGSSIDTAKAANLYATYPADFLTYVNAPLGQAQPVPGRLKPMIAIPTTAGTGSETTGVAIFDFVEKHVKTGISHRHLRPVLGVIDPDNTRSLPPMVAACTGLDVLSHALESLTAAPFTQRLAPVSSATRPAYQGSNPVSDLSAARAIELVSRSLVRAIEHPEDDEARGQMLLAAAFAGIGFGNAGVHLPHAMSYPVSGMARTFRAQGYPEERPLIPHGMSVILNAPAVFRFTAKADPERHLYAARLMGADVSGAPREEAGNRLGNAIVAVMRSTGMPHGLGAVGFSSQDVDQLVEGTLAQQRITQLSPRPADTAALRELFLESMMSFDSD